MWVFVTFFSREKRINPAIGFHGSDEAPLNKIDPPPLSSPVWGKPRLQSCAASARQSVYTWIEEWRVERLIDGIKLSRASRIPIEKLAGETFDPEEKSSSTPPGDQETKSNLK